MCQNSGFLSHKFKKIKYFIDRIFYRAKSVQIWLDFWFYWTNILKNSKNSMFGRNVSKFGFLRVKLMEILLFKDFLSQLISVYMSTF